MVRLTGTLEADALTRKPDVDAAALDALLAQVFGRSVPVSCQRTPDGISTQVYRVVRGSETFYLRVAEEADENLDTDAELHRRLLDLGVEVAQVVHVEQWHAPIGRSIMITTEVPGVPVASVSSRMVAESVLRRAGADLAVLNQMPVDGFGWVRRRGPGWPLRAEHRTFAAYLLDGLPERWPGPLASLFSAPALAAIEEMVAYERVRPPTRAHLAHGDFDGTHIFCEGGRYRGLIDFGEIRGAEPTFDLGHVHLWDNESTAPPLLPALLDGYRQVAPLAPDHVQAIRRSAVLFGLRQLWGWLGPPRSYRHDHPAVTQRVRRINSLVS